MEQARKRYQRNLTKGPVARSLILYSLPFLVTTICQSLVNIVDLIVISAKGKDAAVSGVGIGAQLYILILSIAIGLGLGASIVIGQHYGKGSKDLQRTASNILILFLAIALAITLVVLLLHAPILRLLKTPSSAFSAAKNYTLLSAIGIPFTFLFNSLIAMLRGVGDSKHPMYIALITFGANAVFDIFLVFVLGAQEAGIALAHIFAQILGSVIAILFIKSKKSILEIKLLPLSVDKERIKEVLKVAVPGAIQNSVAALSFLLVTGFINSVSVSHALFASAAGVIVNKYNNFAVLPARSLSIAISAMVAQNVGKQEYDRVRKTFFAGLLLTLAFGAVFAAITLIFCKKIFALFNCSAQTMLLGTPYLRILSIDYILLPFATALYGLVNGYGKTSITMITAILTSLALRVPLAYLLGIYLEMGLAGIGLAMPISTLFSALFTGAIVLFKKKELHLSHKTI